MAKRRMICQTLITDATFNSLSIDAQYLFVRFLSISDDCGILPGDLYELRVLSNPHSHIQFEKSISELTSKGLLLVVRHNNKNFLAFKKSSFEDYQAYLIKNRTKSEYLKVSKDEYELIYKKSLENPSFLDIPIDLQKFPENSGISREKSDNESYHIESKEIKDISKEIKEEPKIDESLIPDFNEPPKPPKAKFTKPTPEQVTDYAKSINFNLSGNSFCDYYDSVGWVVGNKAMKDWKATVRGWKNRNKDKETPALDHAPTSDTMKELLQGMKNGR